MLTGIASVTLRHLPYREVINIVKSAGLNGIEWSGDVHCQPGDIALAQEIATATREAGLKIISYGSYYHIGSFEDFDGIIRTALTLDVKTIRVWAKGWLPSKEVSEEDWHNAIKDSKRIADMAKPHGIDIAYEYHDNTLTDSLETTIRLLNETARENIFTYWQPPAGMSVEENLEVLKTLVSMKKLRNIHVFSHDGDDRKPLEAKSENWKRYITEARPADPALLLEFVKDDDPTCLLPDAVFLKTLV